MQGLDWVLGFEGGEELPCGLGLLYYEMLQGARQVDDVLRQHLFGGRDTQGAGYKVERA